MGRKSKIQCGSGLLILLLGVLMSHRSGAEKVLLVPPPIWESHWFALAKMGQALVDRGHVVTVVASQDIVDKRRTQFPAFRYEIFQDQGTQERVNEASDNRVSSAKKMSVYSQVQELATVMGKTTQHCDLLLGNTELVTRLKAAQYSVIIFVSFFPCGAILAAHIDARVPAIAVLRGDPFSLNVKAAGVPKPWSYVPSIVFSDFTDQMDFVQRLQNVVVRTLANIALPAIGSNVYDGLVSKYLGEKETILSVLSRTDLWLYQTDHLLDFPRPSMPNFVKIGGMNVQEVMPLPEELEAFLQTSRDNGVIIVSLGAEVQTMQPEKAEIFATAFARLPQKVVWRYVGEKPTGLGRNTKLLAWLPQNDLLGHPKTLAFITHSGSNGMFEALHHGVPMVCLPLFADQPGNAARVVARGLGVKLDYSTVTTDKLYEAVRHVLANNSYHETAARLSRMHRDQPQSPMERAVWWIEHAIRHGKLPHLRARAADLPFYQYYLLDVAAFLLAVSSALLGAVWCSCSLMCRKCCCKSGVKPKSE